MNTAAKSAYNRPSARSVSLSSFSVFIGNDIVIVNKIMLSDQPTRIDDMAERTMRYSESCIEHCDEYTFSGIA